ncbi:MAG: hypothetical protein A3G18_09765 [Rhodospirillales bacterium RIFCSPLOWO2_12_FULL_58_28]|nr:MAG: hypothetical protein A3H92_06145 [Rhodospirillales bacterium RIFCSPLOWO2_02_FULL_58_16]OHC78784.1 MAG: hypothetical protein A3G18_09765 [Rhodospirillales bacterium RIFCSPLOWO2_12_FULL_58_28]
MSRAYGANALLLAAFETVYGVSPATGFVRFPFVSSSLGSEQGLIDSDILGQGRDPAAPSRDVIKVEGDIVAPVDLRYFGHWLKALLGAPTTTGVMPGPFIHEFGSGAMTLPSMSVEVGMPEVPAFFLIGGVRVNSMQLNFQRSGHANATFNAIGQGEARNAASQGGIPGGMDLKRFGQFQGQVKLDGSALANLTGANLTYSNNLERIETIRSDGRIDGADPTIAALTGAIEVRFADTALLDTATSGDPVTLEFAYVISADEKLVIGAYEVYLPKPKRAISGPGGVQAGFDWRAANNTVAGRMMTVTLTNDVEAY